MVGLLDVLFPWIALPAKTPIWLARSLQRTAEEEVYDASKVREELLDLQVRFEMGEIGPEAYDQAEEKLMARLEMIERHKEEG